MKATPVLVALAVVAAPAAGQDRRPLSLRLVDVRACGSASPVAAGSVLTITPDGDGVRDCAALRFRLEQPSRVEVVVLQRKPRPGVVHVDRMTAPAGLTTVVWSPPAATPARTYPTRITVTAGGERASFAGPVIRVRALTARFERESYAPGEIARLRLAGGGRSAGLEIVDAATGVAVGGSRIVRGGVAGVRVGRWRPGVYAARLRDGGRVTNAPFVVRAPAAGGPRVAVVLPTSTWQAYNLTDADGDGSGDTWYASRRRESARLDRPFMGDGMPPFFHRYDLPFLRWLRTAGHDADYLGDDDLDRVPDAAALVRRYDLLVFPGHHEYVTRHERDLIEQYRDRGGNLAFLSADSLHWRVERHGVVLRRKEQWRALKHPRPESSIVGVQYRASDDGTHRAAYIVRSTRCAPWLFRGTGLTRGSRFGWSGVEISATTPDSPAHTCVVAEIPNLLGEGRTAQMSYYETHRGAKVFASGAFCLVNRSSTVATLLENLWRRLSRP
jgi:N,N-dimethylformamidase beta subunit-like, C-terminal